jgi:hypothetical protein
VVGDRVELAIERHADLPAEIARAVDERPARAATVRTAFWLVVTGVSLYLVAPSLVELFGSWKGLGAIGIGWQGAMAASRSPCRCVSGRSSESRSRASGGGP